MEIRGIKTVRFTNEQVLNKINEVFGKILKVIKSREKELECSPFQSKPTCHDKNRDILP